MAPSTVRVQSWPEVIEVAPNTLWGFRVRGDLMREEGHWVTFRVTEVLYRGPHAEPITVGFPMQVCHGEIFPQPLYPT